MSCPTLHLTVEEIKSPVRGYLVISRASTRTRYHTEFFLCQKLRADGNCATDKERRWKEGLEEVKTGFNMGEERGCRLENSLGWIWIRELLRK